MKHKRNPIGEEPFDNDVIEKIIDLSASISDHLFVARQGIRDLQEYITAYDDGSWKFKFINDAPNEIWRIERQFDEMISVLKTFKDPEE